MQLLRSFVAALLVIAMATQPAIGVVLNIGTFDGFSDAPQLATPVSYVTVFLKHSNGKRYRAETNAFGIAKVDLPPGTIEHCQAYAENNPIASWACNIPVGKEAIRLAIRNATEQTQEDTPQPIDSRPSTVLTVAGKSGKVQHYVYVPGKKRFYFPSPLVFTYFEALILQTWLISRAHFLAAVTVIWVTIFMGRFLTENAGLTPTQDQGGND